MEKLLLLFILANFTQAHMSSNKADNQTEEVREYVYWDAFSKTFDKTADFWKAESAALEAESIAEERTGVEEWLVKNNTKTTEAKSEDCLPGKC